MFGCVGSCVRDESIQADLLVLKSFALENGRMSSNVGFGVYKWIRPDSWILNFQLIFVATVVDDVSIVVLEVAMDGSRR